MKVTIISIGKQHDSFYKEGIDAYTKRSFNSLSTEWQILPTSNKENEAKGILSALKKDDYVVLLDEKGSDLTSIGLAELLGDKMNDATRRMVFIIGGAYGVTDEVEKRANYVWRLSKLTFPHMLVRVILIEQLYRAISILEGGKYHHE
jgi:23S rRNA (pseudouridine1915-N3)-methyltransferase